MPLSLAATNFRHAARLIVVTQRRTHRLPSVTIPTPAITSAMKPQEPPKKATLATSAAPDAKTTDNRPAPRAEVKAEAKPASRGPARSITTKPAPALRRDSSSLVKSFAKTKERPKTSKPSAGTSRPASPAAEEDGPSLPRPSVSRPGCLADFIRQSPWPTTLTPTKLLSRPQPKRARS